nr:MAG TPA: hypothetical protein [Caudoviricetes sp.]
MAISTTLDGYKYIPIYHQPTSMNTMCVYKILKANEDPVYFLASSELSEWFISRSTFNEMKTHIMPQHYEGFFDNELSAILMAKNVAMDSCITLQKSALEEAQKALAQVTEELVKLQSKLSWEDCDAFKQYYDSQDELRNAAIDREKEDNNDEIQI